MDDASNMEQLKLQTIHDQCFPAATRITTDKGLVRIEDIKVGDKVLSKSESGLGEQEFKPVVRTVKYDNKELWQLTYCIIPAHLNSSNITIKDIKNLSRKGKVFGISATPNHPFWVKDIGWTALDTLQFGQLIEMKDSGTLAFVVMIRPVYKTTESDVAAIPSIRNVLDSNARGFEISDEDHYDFNKYYENGDAETLNDYNSASPLLVEGFEPIHVLKEPFLTTVYNFEVADYHTYYIFDDLWVHNTNCPTARVDTVSPRRVQ